MMTKNKNKNLPKVYIIYGKTASSYDDFPEWTVGAFMDKEQADVYLEKLISWCIIQEIYVPHGKPSLDLDIDRVEELRGKNPFDPNMDLMYYGLYYYIYECPIINSQANFEID